MLQPVWGNTGSGVLYGPISVRIPMTEERDTEIEPRVAVIRPAYPKNKFPVGYEGGNERREKRGFSC